MSGPSLLSLWPSSTTSDAPVPPQWPPPPALLLWMVFSTRNGLLDTGHSQLLVVSDRTTPGQKLITVCCLVLTSLAELLPPIWTTSILVKYQYQSIAMKLVIIYLRGVVRSKDLEAAYSKTRIPKTNSLPLVTVSTKLGEVLRR